MRRAFVSHSTVDDRYVAEMEAFLRAAGFDDVFNDVHAIQPDAATRNSPMRRRPWVAADRTGL